MDAIPPLSRCDQEHGGWRDAPPGREGLPAGEALGPPEYARRCQARWCGWSGGSPRGHCQSSSQDPGAGAFRLIAIISVRPDGVEQRSCHVPAAQIRPPAGQDDMGVGEAPSREIPCSRGGRLPKSEKGFSESRMVAAHTREDRRPSPPASRHGSASHGSAGCHARTAGRLLTGSGRPKRAVPRSLQTLQPPHRRVRRASTKAYACPDRGTNVPAERLLLIPLH
jgi:hypothetical protein